MDYDTFVNSAFIAQGRANEFTRKRPAERKEVFRRVLGLERYQALADAATERRKEAVAELKDLERNAGEAADQVRQLPALESELCAVAAERETMKPELARLDDAVVQLKQAAADHARLEREAREALERAQSLRSDTSRREATLEQLQTDLITAKGVLARGDEVRAAHERVAGLRRQEAELADRQQEATRLDALIAAAERRISVEHTRLESERESRRKELDAAETAAAGLPPLEREETDVAQERTAIATVTRQSEDLERQANDRRAKAAAAGAEANEAARQNSELKEREAQLETVDASCPICLRPLAPGDLDHVVGEYARQREDLRARYDRARAAKAAALDEADELTARATTLRDQVSRRETALRERERDIHARLTAARQAEGTIEPLREDLAAIVKVFDSGAFATDARAEREDAANRLARLGYDAGAHAAIREQLRRRGREEHIASCWSPKNEPRRWRSASPASAPSWPPERGACHRRRAPIEAVMPSDGRRRCAAAAGSQDELMPSAIASRTSSCGWGRRKHVATPSSSCAASKPPETMNARKEEEGVYGDLARAFGRDGVQAMLIDQSLPRVEYTANDMLDRMTGGRIHVSLATQRLLASGRVTETLDIRISDEVGTRDYDMYSGGEAFRVDLALRIALARLLAERAGATLPTLIIDEGFGTQDAEGIDRLIQSITAIQEEFRLILVVTHIDELKERFERRIEVTKAPDRGSLARVF
jgi:exonuclease SbcC